MQGDGAVEGNRVDATEIIRRLDNLFGSKPTTIAGPFGNATGTKVGRYELERVIGRGAFGIVYKAFDPTLNRSVALKIPRPDVLLDSDRLARFEGEVQTCARLDHPGIVPLYEADLSRAVPYMASAYCPGPNLQQWMDEVTGPCEIEAAVSLVEKIARAVQYAHENGVVHRDLKPGNILLVPKDLESSPTALLSDYQPRLTDFGLAQITHGLHESQSSLIIGTPLYMSPEQAESRSEDVGPRSDIFGLGAILYHLLTGVAPYAAQNYAGVLLRLREETPASVTRLRAEVDVDIETVCMKCLQRDPSDRYASAGELADDLLRILNRQPILGRRLSTLQKLQKWSLHSARVYEASFLIIVLSIIRLLFGPGALLMALASQQVSVTRSEMIEIFIANGLLILPNDLWMAWAARRNITNRASGWLYWTALTLSVMGCIAMALISFGIIPSAEWYRRSLGARILVFGLMSMIFYAQTIAWYYADWERIKRGGSTKLRRNLKLILLLLPVLVATGVPSVRYLSRPFEPAFLAGPSTSAQFDGVDDFAIVENVGFDARLPITLEAWIQPDKPHRGAIVTHGPISLTVVASGDGNRFRIQLNHSGGRIYMLDARMPFASNRWTHVAMTFQDGELRMYVNGQLQEYDVSVYDEDSNGVTPNATLPQPLAISDLWPGSRLLIGNIHQVDGRNRFIFSGKIGDVRLSRTLYYHDEFQPQLNLDVTSETALLLHLRDGQERIQDATGKFSAEFSR